MAEQKIYVGKEGAQELFRRLKLEIGKFQSFEKADPAPDGTPDVAVADRKTNVIYLVEDSGSTASDVYKEWIWSKPAGQAGTWECIGNTSMDLSEYALKSEMSVEQGTGADADKTTITLKEGTSATVLTNHQDVSGKADKSEMGVSTDGDTTTITLKSGLFATVLNSHQDISAYVSVNQQSFTSDQKAMARANIGAAEDTAVQTVMIGEGQASKSGTTVTIPMSATGVDGAMSGSDKDKLDGIAQGAQVNTIEHINAGQQELTPVSKTVTIPYASAQNSTYTGGLMTSGMNEKLDGIEAHAEVNVQSDWSVTDTSSDAYVRNKPDLSIYAQSANLSAVATSGSYNDLTTKAPVFAGSTSGLVPAAIAGDASKALRGDGTWGDVSSVTVRYDAVNEELHLDFSPQTQQVNP